MKLGLRQVFGSAEKGWDRFRFEVKSRLGVMRPAVILPYRGFGTERQLWLRARVVEETGALVPTTGTGLLRDAWITFKRFETDEVPRAEVEWRFGQMRGTTESDGEGYVDLTIDTDLEPAPAEERWRDVHLTLKSPLFGGQSEVAAVARVLTPPASARFGVISDVDDTIIKTGARHKLRHWRTLVESSAGSRLALPGLAPFYRALERGHGNEGNPIFYVSASPWNLFDLIERFLVTHNIPLGPILLRDFGLDRTRWFTGRDRLFKLAQIERLFATYPHLPFVLVGDSGQHDPETYAEAVRRHPGRVAAIYIRDVTGASRDQAVERALAPARADGVRIAYGPDLLSAAEDAAGAGWIDPAAIGEVRDAISGSGRFRA